MSPAPVPLPRWAWLLPLLLVGAATLVASYGAVLDVVAYAGVRERLGADEAVDPDFADRATLAMRWPLTVALPAAVSIAASLGAAGLRRIALGVPIALVMVPMLAVVAVTAVPWLLLDLPVGAWGVFVVAATTVSRTLIFGAVAAPLGWWLGYLGAGRLAAFWVAYVALWVGTSVIVLSHELSMIGLTPEEYAARGSWLPWLPVSLSATALRLTFTSDGSPESGPPAWVATLLLLGGVALAVALAGVVHRIRGAGRPSQVDPRRGAPSTT